VPWFKVDDKFHGHRKRRAASLEALGLWVTLGSWSSDVLSDGFIAESVLAQFTNKRRLADELVRSGLWRPAQKRGENGWQFVNWSQFQPTKAKVEKERKEARQRAKASRERSAEVRANVQRTYTELPVGSGNRGEEKKDNPFELDDNGNAIPRLRAVEDTA
jgi:hypothetical protein